MARMTRRKKQAVTIQSVAQRAGVSAMTVSNVVNGTGKAGPAVREAVLEAIRELGYSPNPAAKALASAGTVRVGVLYADPENAFLSAMLVGVLNAASARGAQVVLRACASRELDDVGESLKVLVRGGANALLLSPPIAEMVSGTPLMRALGVPAAVVAPGLPLPDMITVRVDDRAAAQAMTEHLITSGHRRIGFISGPPTHSSSAARREGYAAALTAHGLAFDTELVVAGAYTYESGLAGAERLLDLTIPPTAIFAANDDMAVAALSLAHRRGLAVPADLSIAGFDDTPVAIRVWPALTTIRQPVPLMAERAAAALIARAQGLETPERELDEIVAFSLLERESTARPG